MLVKRLVLLRFLFLVNEFDKWEKCLKGKQKNLDKASQKYYNFCSSFDVVCSPLSQQQLKELMFNDVIKEFHPRSTTALLFF